MCCRSFDNEGIRRLETIVDKAFSDLAIDAKAPYALQTREHIAKLLLQMNLDQWPTSLAVDMLTHRARQSRAVGEDAPEQ
jgi:hypothetical protein